MSVNAWLDHLPAETPNSAEDRARRMTEADPEIRSVADLQAAVTAGIESGVAEEVDLDAFLAEMHKRYLPLAK